jgi:phosphoglycerol transferase
MIGKIVRALGVYAAAGVVSSVVLVLALDLAGMDLRYPFNIEGDCAFTQVVVTNYLEHGTWYTHPRLGWPYGMDLRDFPISETLHLWVMKGLSLFVSDPVQVINWYFLLSFPLTTLTATFAFRRFGVSAFPAVACALLFTFLPFHLTRFAHLFLAAYYLVPLTVVVLLWVAGGWLWRDPREGEPAGRRISGRRLGFCVVVCVAIAMTGVYYAFFSCALLVVAGLAAAVRERRLVPLAVAGLLILSTTVSLGVNLAPCFLYQREAGPNPAVAHRSPEDANALSLKLANLVLPSPAHRVDAVRDWRLAFDASCPRIASGEYTGCALGLVGSLGFLACLFLFLFGRGGGATPDHLRTLGVFTVSCLLLAGLGGFGSLFAYIVSPQIRAYERICVYIAFFSLFTVGLLAQRVLAASAGRAFRLALVYLAGGCVLVGGLWEQTSPRFRPDYAGQRAVYENLIDFVRRIEQSSEEDAAICLLPAVVFPEAYTHRIYATDPFRLFLVARKLRFSHGVVKGRPGDQALRTVHREPTDAMLDRLVAIGYRGLCIDRNGYFDEGRELEAGLRATLGAEPLRSGDGRYVFFSLQERARRWSERQSPQDLARLRQAATYPPLVTGLAGVYPEEYYTTGTLRWVQSRAELRLDNWLDTPRRVRFRFAARSYYPGSWRLELASELLEASLPLGPALTTFERTVVLPPGTHTLTLTTDAPTFKEGMRTFCYALENLQLIEEPAPDLGMAPAR